MKLTERKALELTTELWDWLAANPGQSKTRWPEWKKYGPIESNCFLCEFAFKKRGCLGCPLWGRWGGRRQDIEVCWEWKSPFDKWSRGKDKKANARLIAGLCREKLAELEAEHA